MTVLEEWGEDRSGDTDWSSNANTNGDVQHPASSVPPHLARAAARERVLQAEIERRPARPEGRK